MAGGGVQTGLFPIREPVVDKTTGLLTPRWQVYFRDQAQVIDSNPSQVTTPVVVQAQNTTITTTPIPTGALAGGLYRVTYSAQVTTAAASTSSLTVTLSWTNSGNNETFTGAAMTGNTVGTSQSNTQLVQIDPSTPVSYAAVYASNPSGAMKYTLAVVLEAIG